jgi:hypothetical protein
VFIILSIAAGFAGAAGLGWAVSYRVTRKPSHWKAAFWMIAAAVALGIAALRE